MHIQFVGFASGAGSLRVISKRIASLDASDESAKRSIEMGDILHVENFATRLFGNGVDAYQAFGHG